MNKFVLPVLGLLFLFSSVSAYHITIYAPDTLAVGKPLVVTGTTNSGIGTPIDVVLYYQLTTNTEIKRKIAYVQSDRTFRVVFDTTNLNKGMYKVEVPAGGLGDSINMRLIELIDRTDEISLSSSTQQEFSGKLVLAGSLKDNRNAGAQVEITGSDGERIFGPLYIATNNQGRFSIEVTITKPGFYDVSFTDTEGYIGTKRITVTGNPVETGSPSPVPVPLTVSTVLSAHAKSSRDSPAYFEVKAGSGRLIVYTSSHIDWVMEYIDNRGILHIVNDHGELNPEEIDVQGTGKSIFFKVYPYRYSDNGDVFLYAENAQSVKVSPTVPVVFGGTAGSDQTPATTPTSSPPAVICSAALLVLLLYRPHS